MNKRSKQLLGLGFMLAVILCFGMTVQVIEARHTPAWQSALAHVVAPTAVVAFARAQQPAAFIMDDTYKIRDGGTFDDGVASTQDDAIQLTITLPAAPDDVYCVTAQQRGKTHLFFVNYYTDNLYRSGWLVIDSGSLPLDRARQSQLAAIACRLAVQE